VAKVDEGVSPFPGFKGLRNNVAPDQFDLGDMVAAVNVDIFDTGDAALRKGNSAVVDATATHSVFASGALCLMVQGTTLYRLKPDYTKVALRTGLAANRPMTYFALAGRVFYSNGAQRGVVENFADRSWGLDVPALPGASLFPGTLPAGRYQYTMTYRRADGQESGAALASSIDVPANGGIQFTNIPVPTDTSVVDKVIYLTKANGETLYRFAVLPVAAVTALAVAPRDGLVDLKTQFLGPPPASDVVALFNGYALVAVDDVLYPSEPHALELFDLRKGKRMGARITLVACMTDGVYCCTDESNLWLGGKDPSQWTYQEMSNYGAVPGSLAYATQSQLGKGGGTGNVAFWMSTVGTVCEGADGGAWRDITGVRYSFPKGDRGAGLVRRHRGLQQYVGVMRGVTTAGNSFN
jgi:hypothetical protein